MKYQIGFFIKVREIILLLSIPIIEDWNQFPLLRIDSNKINSLTLKCVILHNFHHIPHFSFLNNGNWFQSSIMGIDSNKIISLTLQCVQIEINFWFLVMIQCTREGFAYFLFGEFTKATLLHQLDRKLVNLPSLQWREMILLVPFPVKNHEFLLGGGITWVFIC